LIIIGVIIALQIILVTFTGMAFGVYGNFGLTIEQWGISILIGSFGLLVNVLLKLLPIAKGSHIHPTSGYGNSKITDIRKSSKIMSLKRVD
jgi:Ca2+ transporting ATPase